MVFAKEEELQTLSDWMMKNGTKWFQNGNIVYYRLSLNYHEVEYKMILTSKTSLLQAPPYSQMYSLRQLSKDFKFANLLLPAENYDNELLIARNIDPMKQNKWNIDELTSFYEMIFQNITHMVNSSLTICFEKDFDWFALPYASPARQYVSKNSHYCCNPKISQCEWQKEPTQLVLVHFVFFGFRLVGGFLLLEYIRKKRKYFFMRDNEAKHVNNQYFTPPWWIATYLPKYIQRKYLYDIRNWVSLLIVLILVIVFSLNLIHTLPPLEWPKDEQNMKLVGGIPMISPDQYFKNVRIGRNKWPGMYAFSLILYPLMMVFVPLTTFLKLRSRAISLDDIVGGYSSRSIKVRDRFIERIIRFFICSFLSVFGGVLIIFYFVRAYEIFEYNDYSTFALGAFVIVLTFSYLNSSKALIIGFPFIRWMLKKIGIFDECGMFTEASYPKQMLRFYMVFLLPTLLFELIWFTLVWTVIYIAFGVITRIIWSMLLLFILYPEQLQVFVFLVTIFGTIGKFFADLNQPHTRMKKMLMERVMISMDAAKAWNEFAMTVEQDELITRHRTGAGLKYFLFLSWEDFFAVSKECNVKNATSKTLGKMVVTIAIISLYFLGSIIFGSSFSGQENQSLKLLVVSFMPLIPKVLQLGSGDSIDDNIFVARFKSAISVKEYTKCPPELTSKLSVKSGKLGLTPHISIVKCSKLSQYFQTKKTETELKAPLLNSDALDNNSPYELFEKVKLTTEQKDNQV